MATPEKPFGMPGASEEGAAPAAPQSDEEAASARAANRFDIRRIIGSLFVLYGVILIALGIFGSHQVKNKAAGINIDLWTGLGMLIFGGLMIFWAVTRPVERERPSGPGSGPIRRAPAT